jgi:3-oxoacyl-[acyl-carrier protein] reductase
MYRGGMGRLQDLVAVVTGAGSGIGRASAQHFAREGARVLVADVRAGAAEETTELVRGEGGTAACVQADVTDRAQVEAMIDAAVRQFGRVDVLFNNAGVPMSFTPFEEVEDALWDHVFTVNVKGVYYGIQAVVPHMRRQGGGVILNTASTAGIRPRPGLAPYAASKAAVISITKTLALELAPHRIRVVAICPVAVDTPMLPSFIGVERGADLATGRERFLASIPWGRFNTAEDIARAAVYLASPEAEMVNGTAFEIDGGRDV